LPAIVLDGENGTATFGIVNNGVMNGSISIAGYQVKGSATTSTSVQYGLKDADANDKTLPGSSGEEISLGGVTITL
jgi:hypothetical protein